MNRERIFILWKNIKVFRDVKKGIVDPDLKIKYLSIFQNFIKNWNLSPLISLVAIIKNVDIINKILPRKN